MMKKIVLMLAMAFAAASGASAQEIFNEVRNIMKQQETIKNDTTKEIEKRKIATFKWDAIYYMIMKAAESSNFTEYELGRQTNAMIDFVNLYLKRLANAKKKADREIIMANFKNATTHNALFNDMDKETIYAYVDNARYLTQFSIDTDWVKALGEVKKQ